MSIKYYGKSNIEGKIDDLFKEMLADEEFTYTIAIHESRENEKLYKLLIEVINIENSNENL